MGLIGSAFGYVMVTRTPLVLAVPLVLLLVFLAVQNPRWLAFFALGFSPLGTMLLAELPGVNLRFTMMSWWLPAAGVFGAAVFRRQKLVVSPATVVLAVYGVFLMSSAFWSKQPLIALREGLQFFTFVWVFLVVELLRTPRQLEAGALSFLGGCTLLVAGSAFSRLATPILPQIRGGSFQLVGEYYHDVTTAAAAGAIVLIAGALLLGARLSGTRRAAVGAALVVGMLLHSAILKRSEAIGLLVGGFLVITFYGWRRSALYGVLGALAVLTIALVAPDVRERFQSATDVQETRWHYALPYVGWLMFKESPIVGQGAGSYSYTAGPILDRLRLFGIRTDPDNLRAPHNMLAKIASEAGLLGLALWGTFLGVVLWSGWVGSREPSPGLPNVQALARGFLGASCLQLLVSLAENVDNAVIFWIILALGYRAARMLQESRREGVVRVATRRRAWQEAQRGLVPAR